MTVYKISESSLDDLRVVLDTSNEPFTPPTSNLDEGPKSKKELLDEASSLLDGGLISEDEYQSMRKNILGL